MRKYISGGGQVISLDQAKDYLKVDHDDEDDLITQIIGSAQNWAEKYTRRQLLVATYDLYLDSFPDVIELYNCPSSDVVTVKYYDTDGDLQTFASSDYIVDVVSEPGRIALAPDSSWPDVQNRINAIVIRYVTGWANGTLVPKPIRDGIMLCIGHLYENRQAITKDLFHELPMGAEFLFEMYKVY